MIIFTLTWLTIGTTLGVLVFIADLHFSERSVQPRRYRLTREEVLGGWIAYAILYPFIWPIVLSNGDINVVVEFIKEISH